MAEARGLSFFSEQTVLERFKSPSSYFSKVPNVAFKPVRIKTNSFEQDSNARVELAREIGKGTPP